MTTDEVPELNEDVQDILLRRLCIPGASWSDSWTLNKSELQPEAKVWYHFVQHHLAPSTHGQTVSLERAYMVYQILQGSPLNVGALIREEIIRCTKRPKQGLKFSGLISQLCLAHQVPTNEEEAPFDLPTPIDKTPIDRLLGTRGRPPPAAKGGEANSSSSTSMMHQIEQRISMMEICQTQMFDQLGEIQRNQLQQQQRAYWEYAAQRDEQIRYSMPASNEFPDFPAHILRQPPPEEPMEEDEAEEDNEEAEDDGSDPSLNFKLFLLLFLLFCCAYLVSWVCGGWYVV